MREASTIRGEPPVYTMCGQYTEEELKVEKKKQEKAKWDTSKIFTAKDGRLTFYYSRDTKDVEFND